MLTADQDGWVVEGAPICTLRGGLSVFSAKNWTLKILASAGIQVNGPQPWDIQIHNPDFYWRVLTRGSLGLGESYMDKWWDCMALDEFFARVLSLELDRRVPGMNTYVIMGLAKLLNMQSRARSVRVAQQHYDVGNDLYSKCWIAA